MCFYHRLCGAQQRRTARQISDEMGYKGNSYRLQKAGENAARYTMEQMEECIVCLFELDAALKSSALPDKSILLQAAMGRLMLARQR